jgi:hypothetical protein
MVVDNPHSQSIIRLMTILKTHHNKVTAPEIIPDGIQVEMKYKDANDLQKIIKGLKELATGTKISIPTYYGGILTTKAKEKLIGTIVITIVVFFSTFLTSSIITAWLEKLDLQKTIEQIIGEATPIFLKAAVVASPPTLVAFLKEYSEK